MFLTNIKDELSFSLKELEKSEIEKRVNIALEQVGMANLKKWFIYIIFRIKAKNNDSRNFS